jgi:predicted methyltransferase
MTKRWGWLALAASAWLAALAAAQPAIEPNIAAAVADASRPPLDRFRDERRKPAQTLAFAGIKEGMKIAELIPGNGYYTRLLSKAVGPAGKVYTLPGGEPRTPLSAALAKNAEYTNIQYVPGNLATLVVPEPVDLVWTSQNYHDLRAQAATINKAVFNALEPGGIYLIVDHAAKQGARNESIPLHRIDEELVKQEVSAAGFVLEAEGDLLRNSKDDRARQVMERDLNRQTDQFILRFRKPQS